VLVSRPIPSHPLVSLLTFAGEPPLFMGSCVFFAIRDALKAARAQFGETSVLHLQSPATPERIRISCADPIVKRAWVEPREGEKSFFMSI
jgi:xanthine dehydrogenase/oxidase